MASGTAIIPTPPLNAAAAPVSTTLPAVIAVVVTVVLATDVRVFLFTHTPFEHVCDAGSQHESPQHILPGQQQPPLPPLAPGQHSLPASQQVSPQHLVPSWQQRDLQQS
ncbi:uncharacterized protein H6S33_002920 [Morchella sextelata]|uniref:uncharacterized protein n=1 Tax=Morchella sextelata TaxID=1174677 RepID=UPI001D040113|nr:uncharacterized protein H6S33_002920 [Morchella sextelata]KAH0606932.1 hypothetical protein H6S33_002920 [Morchella sextelata]